MHSRRSDTNHPTFQSHSSPSGAQTPRGHPSTPQRQRLESFEAFAPISTSNQVYEGIAGLCEPRSVGATQSSERSSRSFVPTRRQSTPWQGRQDPPHSTLLECQKGPRDRRDHHHQGHRHLDLLVRRDLVALGHQAHYLDLHRDLLSLRDTPGRHHRDPPRNHDHHRIPDNLPKRPRGDLDQDLLVCGSADCPCQLRPPTDPGPWPRGPFLGPRLQMARFSQNSVERAQAETPPETPGYTPHTPVIPPNVQAGTPTAMSPS